MQVTVRDMIQIDQLKSLKLIAGEGGMDRPVSKVGILDYEFTKLGNSFCTDVHWQQGEFTLASFAYAHGDPALIMEAVKRLNREKTSGIAIKNVFSLEIPREVLHYADANHFPVFLFTDHSLFFEDIIVIVNRLIYALGDQDTLEQHIASLLLGEHDGNTVKAKALSINYLFRNQFRVAYFRCKPQVSVQKLHMLLNIDRKTLGATNAIAKYENGFFYIHSVDGVSELRSLDIVQELVKKTGVAADDYYIGVSDAHYFLSHLKKALQQSYYAALCGSVTERGISRYAEIGIYKLLLPYADQPLVDDYYEAIIHPIIQYDEANNTNLLDTALLYEKRHGNIREMSEELHSHDNTVRYRMRKIAELVGMEAADGSFSEQLLLAVKIYRIKRAQSSRPL